MTAETKIPQVNFLVSKDLGKRDWGIETLLGVVSKKFTLKELFLKKGSKGGLQYHHKKDELAYLISGSLIVRFDLGDGVLRERVLQPGQSVHFPPGAVHQEEAVTDCIIIEASSPHLNDRVRVEELYGLNSEGGLPTTKIEEVEEV